MTMRRAEKYEKPEWKLEREGAYSYVSYDLADKVQVHFDSHIF